MKETKLGDKYENTPKPRTMNSKKKLKKSKMGPSPVGYGQDTIAKSSGGSGGGGGASS